MSRSRRHTPLVGLAASEQWYKRKGNRRLRVAVRRTLRAGADDVWLPLDGFCDHWNGPKDGRIDIAPDSPLMRK
ncbi:MAG: hypothetical protein KGK07_16025 [Chloroflexota bacterium]|nr:hypothetical protein [Chloroflexota bacterium]